MGDWTVELAEVAKAIKGRAPVYVVSRREDDLRGGFYGPMVLHRVKVGLDGKGSIAGWQHTIVSQPIFIGTPLEPTFRITLSAESHFRVSLKVFYNLLTIRGDCYARATHVL